MVWTFEKVTEDYLRNAERMGFPDVVVDRARRLVRVLKGLPGNRAIMASAALFVACKEADLDVSYAQFQSMFRFDRKYISRYVRIIAPKINLQGKYIREENGLFRKTRGDIGV